jgi:uncharacterized protein (TIGR01244 family)
MTGWLFVALLAQAASIPGSVPAGSIPDYRIIAPGVAAAGQPSDETLSRLEQLGFKTVINLRRPGEAPVVEREKAVVESQGLRYVSVPVSAQTFSSADVERVRSVLDDESAGPVLFHCASSNRVGAVWGVIQVRRGRSLEEAEAAAKAAGLSSPTMIEAFRRVAAEPAPQP